MERRYWTKLDSDGEPKINENTDEPVMTPVSLPIGAVAGYWLDEGMASGYFERPKRNVWLAMYEDVLGEEIRASFDRAWKAFDWLTGRLEAKLDGNTAAYRVLRADAPALAGKAVINRDMESRHWRDLQDGRFKRLEEDGAYT